jgi:phospholipase C
VINRARASALIAGGAALGAIPLPARAAPKTVRGLEKIDHIIVIYLENRSFDHLYGLFPGADGLANAAHAAPQIDANGKPFALLPAFGGRPLDATRPTLTLPPLPNRPFDLAEYVPIDRPLNASFEQANFYYQAQRAINGGAMDGFAAIAGSPVMGYYDGRSLPMWQYAQEYVLADRFFQAAFGGTGMNHHFLFAGGLPQWPNAPADFVAEVAPDGAMLKDGLVTPDGFIMNNLTFDQGARVPLYVGPHIGNRLDAAGISWAWYAGGTTLPSRPYLLWADTAPGTPGWKTHIKSDESEFVADLKNGTLPRVALVKPAENEHPKEMLGLREADQHAADLVRAVQESAYWKSSVIIVTYDEGHSFWDHVAPPKIDRWGPGRRVPAIIISPFAKKRHIDHTPYDTTSILKLIETRFGLEPLGSRDAAAADLTAALQLA